MHGFKWLCALTILLTLVACAGSSGSSSVARDAARRASIAAPEDPSPETSASAAGSDSLAEVEVGVAADEPDIAQVREVAAATADDELICRRETRVGSHMPVRVCRTRAQMEEARREAQDVLARSRSGVVLDDREAALGQ